MKLTLNETAAKFDVAPAVIDDYIKTVWSQAEPRQLMTLPLMKRICTGLKWLIALLRTVRRSKMLKS